MGLRSHLGTLLLEIAWARAHHSSLSAAHGGGCLDGVLAAPVAPPYAMWWFTANAFNQYSLSSLCTLAGNDEVCNEVQPPGDLSVCCSRLFDCLALTPRKMRSMSSTAASGVNNPLGVDESCKAGAVGVCLVMCP